MPTSVHDLELPELDLLGVERGAAIDAVERVRRDHWLARTPLGFALTRYEDVTAILRDRRFHSALAKITERAGVADGPVGQRQKRSILAQEGAEHSRLRRLAAPAFTPHATDRLRPFMRGVIEELVDGFSEEGSCGLVRDLCEPYPIPIICELLGAPRSDWRRFSTWATEIFRIFNDDLANDLGAIENATRELDDYVRAMIDKRRSQPADDLLTRLIAAEEQGDRLSSAELVMMAEAVLMAGTDTTRNQLACSVALFAGHPDQWSALAEDPGLAPAAVEETMRHLGAVQGTARMAAEDVEYHGVTFPVGTLITTSFLAANRDPDVWDDPDAFDIRRPSAASPQLTFGSGIHYCLGASLARAELQEALPILARRMTNLELGEPIQWKPPNVGIWGPSRLALRFTSGQALTVARRAELPDDQMRGVFDVRPACVGREGSNG